MSKDYNRILIKGGILTPGELSMIATALIEAGLKYISFGSRGDLLFSTKTSVKELHISPHIACLDPTQKEMQNIVCSYVSTDILSTTTWLTGDRYLYILEQFKYQPTLKINIADPLQRLVPLFSGHLNFVASKLEDFWYLYLRMPGWEEAQLYPVLIYSWDIATVSNALEGLVQEELEAVETLFQLVNEVTDTNNRTIDSPLSNPFLPFPYYEGINKMSMDKYWLGLYWRNNKYDLEFLRTLCDLCAESKIGKICITQWKSFIIKGIPIEFKLKWEKFLGGHGINVRHSQLELNWHLPVGDRQALKLKNYLVSKLDKHDISTYGLTIGITEESTKAAYFTSIIIERNQNDLKSASLHLRDTYNLRFAKDFDPNTRIYKSHALAVDKLELPGLLIELSKQYFQELGKVIHHADKQNKKPQESASIIDKEVFQCVDCLSIYDQNYGDPNQNIPKETAFEHLPDTYKCNLCDAGKSNFRSVRLPSDKQVKPF